MGQLRVERVAVDALGLETWDATHPVWGDPTIAAGTKVAAVRLYPPHDVSQAQLRALIEQLRGVGVAVKLMPMGKAPVDAGAIEEPEVGAGEGVRQAVDAVLEDMASRLKLQRCGWDDVRDSVDQALGRVGL